MKQLICIENLIKVAEFRRFSRSDFSTRLEIP